MLQALPRLLALDLSALIFKALKLFEINFFLLIDQNTNTYKDSNLGH